MFNSMTEDKRSYYAIIPASVRYDDNLTPNAKLLYGEITALCNEKGYCWASNDYFSKLYGVSNRTVIDWINQLVETKHITRDIQYKPNSKEVEKRVLKLPYEGSEKNITTLVKKTSGGSEENFTRGSEENFTDNITLFNTTNNTTFNNNTIAVNYQNILDAYHSTCTSLPAVIKLTDKRKKAIKARLKTFSEADIQKAFEKIEASDFCSGRAGKWKANFDWIFANDSNLLKVLEGNYDNKTDTNCSTGNATGTYQDRWDQLAKLI